MVHPALGLLQPSGRKSKDPLVKKLSPNVAVVNVGFKYKIPFRTKLRAMIENH